MEILFVRIIKMSKVEIAKQIATEAHEGQKRSDGKDYITHPESVADLVATEDLKVIAWLHDVLEDTEVTAPILQKKGIPNELIYSIIALSRYKKEDYKEYILRVSKNKNAIIVKLADLKHNLSNLKKGNMRDKYILTQYFLEEELKKII